MAASVDIVRITGAAPGSATTITGINSRANAYDGQSTADATSPIQVPASGSNYSYWVTEQLLCTATPAGTINNLRWYTNGANNFGTGWTALAQEATSYVQASGTVGQTGLPLNTTNHAGITGPPVDPFTFTSASPKSLAGSLSNPSTGRFGSMLVFQLVLSPSVNPGPSGQSTFYWKYDET